MKHAYLIIAHHEFGVLKQLLEALDDDRNVIYLHLDKKIKEIPQLPELKKTSVYILQNRIDVRWGHVSQILAEYALWEYAYQDGPYDYYHLISGVHMPLYEMDYLDNFFQKLNGLSVFSPMITSDVEQDGKLHRYNFFLRQFARVPVPYQLFWRIFMEVQRRLGIRRDHNQKFKKASNWCSLSQNVIEYLLKNKKNIIKKYKYTMCGDEFFVPSELANELDEFSILYSDRLLRHQVGDANADILTLDDYDMLIDSQCLFARKFSEKHFLLIDKIRETWRERL